MEFTKSKLFVVALYVLGGGLGTAVTGGEINDVMPTDTPFLVGGLIAIAGWVAFDICVLGSSTKSSDTETTERRGESGQKPVSCDLQAVVQNVDDVLRRACTLEQEGDYKQAITLFEQVARTQDHPESEYAKNSAAELRARWSLGDSEL